MKVSRIFGTVCLVGVVAMGEGLKKETSISLGAAATDGNSQTMQLNLGLESAYEWEGRGTLDFGAKVNYGKQEVDGVKETNIDNAKATLNGKRLLSESVFVYGDTSIQRDDIARIDYRGTIGPGVGCYLWESDSTKLLLEVGPSYVFERVDSMDDDYAALRLAQEYRQTLGETAKLWQTVEYLPRMDDFDQYLINGEIGIEAAINSHMNLRLVLQDAYDSTPPADVEHNDISLVAGFGIRL